MGHKKCLFVLFVLGALTFAAADKTEKSEPKKDDDPTTQILDDLFKNCDKRIRPNNGKQPVNIRLSIFILDVFNIDEVKHEFSVNMYFRQHWEDPRLIYKPLPNMDRILIDSEHAKKLWIPDTFMPNERKTVIHQSGPVQEMTKVSPSGKVLRSQRLTVTAACKMSLGYFPFDNQLCSLEIESYGYSAKDVVYGWNEGKYSVGFSEGLGSLKYRVTGVNTKSVVLNFDTGEYSGNYSRLGLEFFMVRNGSRYMQDAYFPAIVLAVLAMLTLFMGSLLTRVQLSMVLMGFMIIFVNMNSNWMPRVSYQTALDLYIFICTIIVFHVVIVNFILHVYNKPSSPRPKRQNGGLRRLEETRNGDIDEMEETLCDSGNEDSYEPSFNTRFEEIIYRIAKRSKHGVPIAFLGINVIYWLVVLIGSSGFPEDFILVENRG